MPAHKSHVTRWLTLEGFKRYYPISYSNKPISTVGFVTQQMPDYIWVHYIPAPGEKDDAKLSEMASALRTKGYTVSTVENHLEVRKPG